MLTLICEYCICFCHEFPRAQSFEPCKAWLNSQTTPIFFLRVLHSVLELHVIRIDEMNASELPGIVRLQFLTFLTKFLATSAHNHARFQHKLPGVEWIHVW